MYEKIATVVAIIALASPGIATTEEGLIICSASGSGPAGITHGKAGVSYPDPSSNGDYRETWLCVITDPPAQPAPPGDVRVGVHGHSLS